MADVVEKPNGKMMMRWRVQDAAGVLVRRAKMYDGRGGKRAALAEAARIEAQARAADKVVSIGTMTFQEYVKTRWLPHQAAHTAARTYDTDRGRIRTALPYIGALKLTAIGPADIDAMTTAMLSKGWSKLYVKHHFNVVRSALRQASKWCMISGTPWQSAKVIVVPKGKPKVATIDESDRLADALWEAGKPVVAALVTTLAETGARPGEALALHWDQIDLEAGTVSIWRALEAVGSQVAKARTYRIKSAPKNDASVRVIRVGAGLVGILRSLKVWHAEQHVKSGGAWPRGFQE